MCRWLSTQHLVVQCSYKAAALAVLRVGCVWSEFVYVSLLGCTQHFLLGCVGVSSVFSAVLMSRMGLPAAIKGDLRSAKLSSIFSCWCVCVCLCCVGRERQLSGMYPVCCQLHGLPLDLLYSTVRSSGQVSGAPEVGTGCVVCSFVVVCALHVSNQAGEILCPWAHLRGVAHMHTRPCIACCGERHYPHTGLTTWSVDNEGMG